jgi:arabinose-5-phosphate isomerase
VRVGDVIGGPEANPVVPATASFEQTILELTGKNRGAVSVVGEDGRLAGIVTDGDLKRILTRSGYRPDLVVGDLMTRDPLATTAETMGVKALDLMETRKTTVLPVVDAEGRPVAMLHMHDLIRAGIT